MHAILALAARHLQEAPRASKNQLQRNYGIREAYHLQKALSSFSDTFNHDIHANQDAVLATSFLLFFHVSSVINIDPLPKQPCEDASFTFLRGIRSVVADGSRLAHSGRYKTLVAPPVYSSAKVSPLETYIGRNSEFLQLMNSLHPQSPYLHNREIYIERFKSLMLHLSIFMSRNSKAEGLEEKLLNLLRWQALCPAVFVELVKADDPIALIIMAHYHAAVESTLSQARNKWWWFQRKPRHMVQVIGEYIGPAWDSWLEWPRAVVSRY
ncbi:hypothetical protein DM02DRAFT_618055 [Periconia macrospinosa]|uniref:Uncharacterized protein n=1 Tax=Periconia macrospinosa TaxID=97972 RepID=A0A2V1DAM8_9PLEO|nr:hypothetical protein DM02DRAFT_618055 [Periconia macrospinosa]